VCVLVLEASSVGFEFERIEKLWLCCCCCWDFDCLKKTCFERGF